MENTQSTQSAVVANAINIFSGAYAASLVDALQEICEADSLQGVCHAIEALSEEHRPIEAIQLIQALMDITNIECPEELGLLEENEAGVAFVKEFVSDLEDILYSELIG